MKFSGKAVSGADFEGGAGSGNEFARLVSKLGFGEGDGFSAMANPSFTDQNAGIGAAHKAGFEFECYLWRARFLMGKAHSMAAETIQHCAEKAAEYPPSPIEEPLTRNKGSADKSALRIFVQDLFAESIGSRRFPVFIHDWCCYIGCQIILLRRRAA